MTTEPIVVEALDYGARVLTIRGHAQWTCTPVILGVPYRQITHIFTVPGDSHDGIDLGFGKSEVLMRFTSANEALEQASFISQKMNA